MESIGHLRKMRTENALPVNYYLKLGSEEVYMNELIGKEISMQYLSEIACIKCGRITNKSFSQGYCYPCFVSAPETEECVLRPELCQAHEGIARDMEYAKEHCLSEQVVYLSLTSDLKVGVTRASQVPVRWIDQGATKAVELARTPNRHTAGSIEVSLKKHLKDKTNWRAMLKDECAFTGNLLSARDEIITLLSENHKKYVSTSGDITQISYPVEVYPEKVRSLNFDKDANIKGFLQGIKGQYLIFDDNRVLNIRKFGGYKVRLEI